MGFAYGMWFTVPKEYFIRYKIAVQEDIVLFLFKPVIQNYWLLTLNASARDHHSYVQDICWYRTED
jgi:hypothetical protein